MIIITNTKWFTCGRLLKYDVLLIELSKRRNNFGFGRHY